MIRRLLGLSLVAMLGVATACSGSDGQPGTPGEKGDKGDKGDPGSAGGASGGVASVSAITPTLAYLGRTIDVIVSGDNTKWSKNTVVDFGDKIKVNEVIAASPTALHVNITIANDAAVDYRDVKITDGSSTLTYAGAFEVQSPIEVSTDQASGIPQGGFAIVHSKMVDVSTPFDTNNTAATFSSADVSPIDGLSATSDFSFDFVAQTDVLAAAGDVDMVVSSGPMGSSVDSPAPKALKIAARAPTALMSGMPVNPMITAFDDSGLYSYTPADANLRFVQMILTSTNGQPAVRLIPKSGKIADALGLGFFLAAGPSTAMDTTYFIVGDSGLLIGNPFAPPPPYDYTLVVNDTLVTAATEDEGANTNNSAVLANNIPTLPGLVTNGDLSNAGNIDEDWYKFTVTGSPKKIHIATGGDLQTDAIVEVFGISGNNSLGASTDVDYQEDLVVDAPKDGTYFVKVSASDAGFFDPAHSSYVLFVDVK